jgi:uncharacterized protein
MNRNSEIQSRIISIKRKLVSLKVRLGNENTSSPDLVVILNAFHRASLKSLSEFKDAYLKFRDQESNPTLQSFAQSVNISTTKIYSVLIKPVSDACNLQCTYCYEGEGNERTNFPKIEDKTLENIIRDTLSQANGLIKFAWHGGEPLLSGIDTFRKGVEFQKKFNDKGYPILNTVQTNGLLLNEEWVAFLKQNKFQVGLSIDGSKDIHDQQRIGKDQRGSYDQVIEAIKLLKTYNIPFGIISVISNNSEGRAKDFFENFREIGINSYDIHPDFGMNHNLRKPVFPKVFSDFVIDLFEAWLAYGQSNIHIRFFDDVFQYLSSGSPSTCYFAGSCTNIIAFESNGDAIPCTRPFDREKYTFGNIKDQSLDSILSGDKFLKFKNYDVYGQQKFNDCPWFEMCHNGCPQHRITDGLQNVAGDNFYCNCKNDLEGGYADIFDHIIRRIWEIVFDPTLETSDEKH